MGPYWVSYRAVHSPMIRWASAGALEIFVDQVEVLDFAEGVGRVIAEIVDCGGPRVGDRYGQDLRVLLALSIRTNTPTGRTSIRHPVKTDPVMVTRMSSGSWSPARVRGRNP